MLASREGLEGGPGNHVASYAYDACDRQTQVTSPMGSATSFRYDVAGNRIGRTDANGAATTLAHALPPCGSGSISSRDVKHCHAVRRDRRRRA